MPIKYNLPESTYTPVGLKGAGTEELAVARIEYARLRRAAEKRLNRLSEAGFEWSDTYEKHSQGFVKPSGIKDARELAFRLTEVKNFLDLPTSTLKGQRQAANRTLRSLQSHGYYFVTEENLGTFINFMEAARMKAGGKLLASDRVAEMYEAAEKKHIPPEELLKDFDYWRANVEELNKSYMKHRNGVTPADYKKTIETRKKRIAREKKKRGL